MSKKEDMKIVTDKNLWELPSSYLGNPEGYLAEVVRKYGDAYSLMERGRELLFRSARAAYQEAGVFGDGIAAVKNDEMLVLSRTVDINVILGVMAREDTKAHDRIRLLFMDENPINACIKELSTQHDEVSKAFGGTSGTFRKAKCPLCGADANILIQGISPLETGTSHGGFILRFVCRAGCEGSPVQYILANSEAGAVYGILPEARSGQERGDLVLADDAGMEESDG